MTRTTLALLVTLSLAASTAFAQDEPTIQSAEEIAAIVLEEATRAELPPIEPSSFATRVLSYEAGVEALQQNNLQVQIARQALEDAAVIDSQARSIFVPNINVTGQVTYNSREVNLTMGNMFAPFSPYLES